MISFSSIEYIVAASSLSCCDWSVYVRLSVSAQPACSVEAVAFVPPAVEHREVEHAVHFSLFARCARCFQRTGRGVQPDVYAGNKALGHNHIVVLEEYYLSEELGHARYLGDALDKALAGAVGG